MEPTIIILTGGLAAYLIGSITTSVWAGKLWKGIDIRDYGSGNAGATNTFRVLGKTAGSLVMAIDIVKGWFATFMATFLPLSAENIVLAKLILGVCAVAGHIFPLYEKFKGGKGVATLLGMVFAIHWQAALICLGIFLVVFLLSRFVSLGSITAALAFPALLFIPSLSPEQPYVKIFGIFLCLIVLGTHIKNIRRLLKGDENKITFS